MQRPVRVVFSIPVSLTLFAEELGAGWGGAGVNRSQGRLVKMTEEKGKEKPGCILKLGSRGYSGLTLIPSCWTFLLYYINCYLCPFGDWTRRSLLFGQKSFLF